MAQNLIVWADSILIKALPLTRHFEPVRVWDNAEKTFKLEQATDPATRLPLWEAEALLPMGWGKQSTPIRVRTGSSTRPTASPDPARLLAVLDSSSLWDEWGTDDEEV